MRVLVFFVTLILTGCGGEKNIPTSPTPSTTTNGSSVTGVTLTAQNLSENRVILQGAGSACKAEVAILATVRGTGEFNPQVLFANIPGLFQTGDATATLSLTRGGDYRVTATSRQGGISGELTITAVDACSQQATSPPPPATPLPPVTPPPPATGAVIVKLTASPSVITQGGSSLLTWSSTNATSCRATGGVVASDVTLNGTYSVSPKETTTYSLTCTGPAGTASASSTVTVNGSLPGAGCTYTLVQPLSPSTGSGTAGQKLQLSVRYSSQSASGVTCGPPSFYSSNDSRVMVDTVSGMLTFLSPGVATVCAQPSKVAPMPQSCGTFTTR